MTNKFAGLYISDDSDDESVTESVTVTTSKVEMSSEKKVEDDKKNLEDDDKKKDLEDDEKKKNLEALTKHFEEDDGKGAWISVGRKKPEVKKKKRFDYDRKKKPFKKKEFYKKKKEEDKETKENQEIKEVQEVKEENKTNESQNQATDV